jgi:hypothetical protein
MDLDHHELGLGTYISDEHLPGLWAGLTTPKIELDDGWTIYGYECWWTDE